MKNTIMCLQIFQMLLNGILLEGFFDGDGCITLNNKGQGSFEIGCHNKTFITSLHDYMSRYITTNSNVTIGDGTWRIRYCGNRQIHQVYNFMYENALLKNG